MTTIIILSVWLVGAIVAYCLLKQLDVYERVWLSAVWFLLLPLYVIHWLHNKKW